MSAIISKEKNIKKLSASLITTVIVIVQILFIFISECGSIDTEETQSKIDTKKSTIAEYVPGELLVKFKPNINPDKPHGLHIAMGSVMKKEFKEIGVQRVKISDNITVEEAVQSYKQDPDVEYAEPNYIVHALTNDTYFNNLWGLNNTGQTGGTIDADIDAPEAWGIQTGSSNTVIAVIDTGVDYTHEDIAANMWVNSGEIPNNGIDNDGNGYIDDIYGINTITGSGDPLDDNGHGTHVAGTIGAEGNNGKGVVGVNHQIKIMALKFLDFSGSASTADAIECINYVIAMKTRGVNVKVTNNSWGGSGFSQALYDAIKLLMDNGILFVAAAGNDGINNDNPLTATYPASYNLDNIISVAASDQNDNLASFSNYGATSVDLAAPGKNIYSTLNGGSYSPQLGDTFFDNMEAGASNWTADSSWAITAEQNHTSGGGFSWSDSPNVNYANNLNISIISKTINLGGMIGDVRLGFWIKGDLENGFDYLVVEVSGNSGALWNPIGSVTGTIPTWQLNSYFISPVYRTTGFKFRLRLYTDNSTVYDGVYIDDVGIGIGSGGSNNYNFLAGTSMATPHVSGVAGLILSTNSSLTYQQVKDLILNNVDSISGMTVTGGRLNAYKALSAPSAPTNLSAAAISSSQINLSWQDNSSSETGFKIDRKTGAGGTYSQIDSVGADVTTYSDTSVSASTTYYYRVRAYDTSGDSYYSNEVNSTTLTSSSTGGSGDGGGKGCFIATAAYGSPMHPYVETLRKFRDKHLLRNYLGRKFVDSYYKYSPQIADVIRDSEFLKGATRTLLTPIVMFVVYPYASSTLLIALFISLIVAFRFIKRRKEIIS